MPTLEWNTYWDTTYEWPHDGDEWADQAAFCGVPYAVWKGALVGHFVARHVRETSTVLEIAPGHGRWTAFLAGGAKRYVGVDLSPSCVRYCTAQFAALTNTEFHVGDGRSLPMVEARSVDFAWSFDSFVHIEPDVTGDYLAELARVLVPGGRACIHHPGNPSDEQRRLGLRSAVTATSFASMAVDRGLRVVSQSDSWGPGGRCTTRRFADCITTLEQP
jgi:SAM-dependent methyltransferase